MNELNFQLTQEHCRRVEEFRSKHKTGVLTLLFTDMVGSVALKRELGDAAGAALVLQQKQTVRELLPEFREAEEIDAVGDSFFIVFIRPSDAVRFALRIHYRLKAISANTPKPIRVRIGIHMGEVYYREKSVSGGVRDVIGIHVDIAARVMELAESGQTLMSCGVFNNARAILGEEAIAGLHHLTWLNHGPYRIKGIEEPFDICEVGEEGLAPLSPPADSEKAHRYISPDMEPVLGWRPALNQEVPTAPGWVLIEKLGEGGFGEVWKAQHKTLKEIRVFKFCFRADRIRSLKREVTLFQLLKEHVGEHPNIVRIYDVYFDEPPYYIETEYIEGKNLIDWCEEQGGAQSVPIETRLEIVAQVAEALQAAHDSGVIHRDVKPSNILIKSKGISPKDIQVKLTDFGIGEVVTKEILSGKTGLGFTETFMASELSSRSGTRLYMAPELLADKPSSTRTDTYSLGVVLYQLLIGDLKRPVTTDWKKDVDDSLLADDLEKCFAGDPGERFAGVIDLAQRLRTLPQRRIALAKRKAAERAAIRRRRFAVVFASSAGLLLLLAIVLAYGLHRERIAYHAMERENYYATIALVRQSINDGHPKRAGELLASCPKQYRHWEWGRLQYLRNLDLMTLKGHTDWVRCVAFSPDGRYLATGSADTMAKLWDLEMGREVLIFQGHSAEVRSVAFSHDGRYLATASTDKSAKVWDVETGREVLTISSYNPIQNPHGHAAPVESVAFSPEGKRLATASMDRTAKIWDVETGRKIRTFTGHRSSVSSVAFSPDGKRLATGSNDTTAKLWNLETGEELRTFEGHTFSVLSVTFSPEGKYLATGSEDRTAKLWNVETGRELRTLKGHTMFVQDVAFSPDGSRLATAGDERVAKLWDTETGQELLTLRGHSEGVFSIAFSPDGKRLATVGGLDLTAKVWDVEAAQGVQTLMGHTSILSSLTFSADSTWLATASYDGTARLWDAETGGELLTLGEGTRSLFSLALSPDDSRLATGGASGIVRIWDWESRNEMLALKAHSFPACSIAFSPDGRYLATASGTREDPPHGENMVKLWDANTGRQVLTLKGHTKPVCSVAFSPDGRHLATGSSDFTVRVWKLTSGKEHLKLSGNIGSVFSLAYSPDGKRLAAGGRAGKGCVWDAETGRKLATLRGAGALVFSVAFSPDGKRIATGSWDKTARIWDAETGREILALKAHDGPVVCVAFSPDGTSLATAGEMWDNTAILWPSFSWNENDYPGDADTPLEDRIELYKREYWKERLEPQAKISNEKDSG